MQLALEDIETVLAERDAEEEEGSVQNLSQCAGETGRE
jgi:hypothetical protein